MDKKYFDGGRFQVLPMALGIILAAPFGSVLVRGLGIKVTELPMLVAGSISGALVAIVSWLIMVLLDQASAKK
jgi:Na+/proline symporter